MLFLRLDQALEVLKAARNLKERLVVRYALWNGLSAGEIAAARIEYLDPVECRLFLPWRHWKKNQLCSIDPETVRLQIIYSGARKAGPLLRSQKGGHFRRQSIYEMVNRIAGRTSIPGKEGISPRTLKRTCAREWVTPVVVVDIECPHCGRTHTYEIRVAPGTLGTLQKQLGHKHLWSTAHYLRFDLEDVRRNHARLMERVEHAEASERPRLVS